MKLLYKLASLYGVQTRYRNTLGKIVYSPASSITTILKIMGADVTSPENEAELVKALRKAVDERCERMVEPAYVAWNGELSSIGLTTWRDMKPKKVKITVTLEDGSSRELVSDRLRLGRDAWGCSSVKAIINQRLPLGYHRIKVTVDGEERQSHIISAPEKAYQLEERKWGVFAPIYSLRTENDQGIGSYSDLLLLAEKISSLGGAVVATLPFYAVPIFVTREYSPYSPASRLMLNELYLDTPNLNSETKNASGELVDYIQVARKKREMIEKMADNCDKEDFQRFLSENPLVTEYAKHMATLETVNNPEYFEKSYNYYVFSQYATFRQLENVVKRMREIGVSLYADLPVGFHPKSYDMIRYREIYTEMASIGAPPDLVFADGQDWGFPPPIPDKLRLSCYKPFAEALQFIMRTANILRIDHVMLLHRLFWIPRGKKPTEGVYVRYNTEEMYAVLTLESHRNQTVVVGENLGTVPTYVEKTMRRHGLMPMYVMQNEAYSAGKPRNPSPNTLAAINTHDMPPLMGFLTLYDIRKKLRPGNLDYLAKIQRAAVQRLLRMINGEKLGGREILRRALNHLSRSKAKLVIISLDDLLLEKAPQNIPASVQEYPNWRKRYRHTVEEIFRDKWILETLHQVDKQVRRISRK